GQNIQKWGDGNKTYMTLSQNRLTVENQVLVGNFNNAPNLAALCVNTNLLVNTNAIQVFETSFNKIQFCVKSDGFVYAREINVMPMNIQFPDYVFDNTYKLKTLHELETYLKQNRHLPNIPTAKEVNDKGINLAEMQVKQMEKIEELFLYVIELKKENEALKKKMTLLESKN
ncbi:MAG: hypothetical protein HYZ42_16005, partial [Bacteroidetes bacterium]|nr:hypothetical protein [Bacteroidota bacterium]